MRVFVTGASGFIGRRLLPVLRSRGYEVTALLLPDEDARRIGDTPVVRGDITRESSLASSVKPSSS